MTEHVTPGIRNVENTFGLLLPALTADQGVIHEAAEAVKSQTRRGEDCGLVLGEIDDHLEALRRLQADVLGHEYESLQQIADAIEDIRDQLEGLL